MPLCRNGHERTAENTYTHPQSLKRWCRTCARASKRRSQEKFKKARKEAALNKQRYRQEITREQSLRKSQRWQPYELRMIFDLSYTDMELATELSRTFAAIASTRIRYKHLRPNNWEGKNYKRVED